MRSGLIAVLLLASVAGCAQEPMSQVTNVYSDKEVTAAKEYVEKVSDKMPQWDADWEAPYERAEIAKVKLDIMVCADDGDVAEFMDHVQTLRDDADTLIALDDFIQRMHTT
jgi:hypothetical protein